MMNDSELDALLSSPLPERDAADFSVALMERIAQSQARPARILSWISVGILFVVIAAACIFGARVIQHDQSMMFVIPTALVALMLLLSGAVMRSARE